MFELIVLLVLSILTARILEKRFIVASALHAVLFIVQLALFFSTSELGFVKYAMTNIMGKELYAMVHDALTVPSMILQGGISVVLLLDISIFVFLPLLSVVVFVKEIKETFKEMKVKTNIRLFFTYIINLVLDPVKDFKHNKNETYLILERLLN